MDGNFLKALVACIGFLVLVGLGILVLFSALSPTQAWPLSLCILAASLILFGFISGGKPSQDPWRPDDGTNRLRPPSDGKGTAIPHPPQDVLPGPWRKPTGRID